MVSHNPYSFLYIFVQLNTNYLEFSKFSKFGLLNLYFSYFFLIYPKLECPRIEITLTFLISTISNSFLNVVLSTANKCINLFHFES